MAKDEYEVRQDSKNGDWGIFLKDYNVSIAYFNKKIPKADIDQIKKIFDQETKIQERIEQYAIRWYDFGKPHVAVEILMLGGMSRLEAEKFFIHYKKEKSKS